MTYKEYLASPAWRQLRELALQRDQYCCRLCTNTEQLEVHHRHYENFGREDLNDLTTLCRTCHDLVHRSPTAAAVYAPWLPRLSDVPPSEKAHLPNMHSSYKDTIDATTCEVPPGRRCPLDDAQWSTRGPLEPLFQGHQANNREAKKTDADHEEVGRLEWHGSLYLTHGKPCVPFNCIRATLHNAAKTLRLGPKVKAGLFVTDNALLVYDGPTDLDVLWADEHFETGAICLWVDRRSCGHVQSLIPGVSTLVLRITMNC